MVQGSSDIVLEYFKKRLLDRRQEISETLECQAESVKPVDLDQSSIGRVSRADALQQQSMAVAMKRRMQLELQRIESALRRIERGEYGICVVCEEPIPKKRLEVDPSITTCVKCVS